jgi:hypothetical protein
MINPSVSLQQTSTEYSVPYEYLIVSQNLIQEIENYKNDKFFKYKTQYKELKYYIYSEKNNFLFFTNKLHIGFNSDNYFCVPQLPAQPLYNINEKNYLRLKKLNSLN